MITPTRTPAEALEKAIEVIGGVTAFLKVLRSKRGCEHLEHGHLYHWRKKAGQLPPEYCPVVEFATRLKGCCIPCEELNPEVDWSLVRGTADERKSA
jgi:DNA-binding transcriptional regulator YdaS (Cro superfamily)